MQNQFALRFESESSSSSSDEEDRIPISDAYKVLDIRSGLLSASRYCTAVKELTAVISSLYKCREATKELKKLVEADVQFAIFQISIFCGEIPNKHLRYLMTAVETTLPQAKRNTLCREYKQKMLQIKRDEKKTERQQKQQDEDDEEHKNQIHSFADLPAECIENIFDQLKDDPYTLAIASCTCSTWRHHAKSNKLWERIVKIVHLTFGKAVHGDKSNDIPHDWYFTLFSTFTKDDMFLTCIMLPFRTDRIICHGDAIRWCSPETRARVLANPGTFGIPCSRTTSVLFLEPQDVVFYLIARDAQQVVERKSNFAVTALTEFSKLVMATTTKLMMNISFSDDDND